MPSTELTPGSVQPPAAACAPGVTRYANIDRLRLVALFDITYFHVAGGYVLYGLGLPIFLMFTAALNARPPRDPEPRRFVGRKVRAFLLPWVAWSVVYGMVFTLSMAHRGSGALGWFEPGMLLVGTQWHLWYMVFGLVASLGAFFARRYTQRIDGRLIIMLASLLGCAVMVLEREFAGVPARAAAWLLAIPSIPIGIALGRCLWEENRRTRIWNTILTFAIVCGGMAALEVRHWGYSADRYMLAILPVCLVVLWRGVPDAFTAWLTRLRMGVYLIHPLMIRVFMSLLGDHSNAVVRTVVVILASIGCVWLMSKSPLRWMVLTRAVEETDRSGPPRVHRFRGAWKHAA